MGSNSKIGWTTHSLNFWIGCTKKSPGCAHCYAESWAIRHRYGDVFGVGKERRHTKIKVVKVLRTWQMDAKKAGEVRRVFINSLSDIFDTEVEPSWRENALDLLEQPYSNLVFILLTKRAENLKAMLAKYAIDNVLPQSWWIGVSAENQAWADKRIPLLLDLPYVTAVRFASLEPLLDEVSLRQYLGADRLNWVIVGGESGEGFRPMQDVWAYALRDDCAAANVPFFFKQHSDRYPGSEPSLAGKFYMQFPALMSATK